MSAFLNFKRMWSDHECQSCAAQDARIKFKPVLRQELTVESFSISASDAPREARPISWENCAKLGSAKSGMWPSISWIQSLQQGNAYLVTDIVCYPQNLAYPPDKAFCPQRAVATVSIKVIT
jgi:hypothetical protein